MTCACWDVEVPLDSLKDRLTLGEAVSREPNCVPAEDKSATRLGKTRGVTVGYDKAL